VGEQQMADSDLNQLQKEFRDFREACMWLRICFNTGNYLFGSDAEVEAILNQSAPLFFTDLNTILQEYFFLQVRRITDPEKTHDRENLTLLNLNSQLRQKGRLTPRIEALTSEIQAYGKFVRNEIVNRRVAHADKQTALKSGLVGEHPAENLDAFLENIQAYTDEVGNALRDEVGNALRVDPLDYRVQPGKGDVRDLVHLLKRGLAQLQSKAAPNKAVP
jgi:hypothetical protein